MGPGHPAATVALAASRGVPADAVLRSIWPGMREVEWVDPPDSPAVFGALTRLGPGARRGYGYDLDSPASARLKARAEAVERAVWVDRTPRALPPADVDGVAGRRFMPPPTSWWPPGAPDPLPASDHRGIELRWAAASDLLTGASASVPLQLVGHALPPGERAYWPRTSAGTAAHATREQAIVAALVELCERDAIVVNWLLGSCVPVVDLASGVGPAVEAALGRLWRAGLSVTVLSLPTDAPLFVAAALVEFSGQALVAGAMGLGGSPSPRQAVLKAITEAAGLWSAANRHVTQPLDIGPADLDAATRGPWWGERSRWRRLVERLAGETVALPTEVWQTDAAATMTALLDWLRTSGYWACVVDLLEPPLTRRCGYHVVRVVASGLHPFWLSERMRCVDRARLERIARLRGVPVPAQLNPDPHPFP